MCHWRPPLNHTASASRSAWTNASASAAFGSCVWSIRTCLRPRFNQGATTSVSWYGRTLPSALRLPPAVGTMTNFAVCPPARSMNRSMIPVPSSGPPPAITRLPLGGPYSGASLAAAPAMAAASARPSTTDRHHCARVTSAPPACFPPEPPGILAYGFLASVVDASAVLQHRRKGERDRRPCRGALRAHGLAGRRPAPDRAPLSLVRTAANHDRRTDAPPRRPVYLSCRDQVRPASVVRKTRPSAAVTDVTRSSTACTPVRSTPAGEATCRQLTPSRD